MLWAAAGEWVAWASNGTVVSLDLDARSRAGYLRDIGRLSRRSTSSPPLFGPYYEGNEGTALYNSSFRPFQSPVPFLFVRHGVTGDWKFFLDDEEWLNLWAHRYGESGAQALAEELRRTNWRLIEA
jgi:hypothetical protein